MSFEAATEQMSAALAAGDLDALKNALEARAEALGGGAKPSLESIEAGERALLDLAVLKQKLAFEDARLSRIRTALIQACPRPHVDYQG